MRYPLRASIVYRWRDPQGMQQRAKGRTEDVSEEGVLVCAEHCPSLGDLVDLVLRLPTFGSRVPAPALRMEMKAKVIRVLRDAAGEKNLGFAAQTRETAAAIENRPSRATSSYPDFVGPRAN